MAACGFSSAVSRASIERSPASAFLSDFFGGLRGRPLHLGPLARHGSRPFPAELAAFTALEALHPGRRTLTAFTALKAFHPARNTLAAFRAVKAFHVAGKLPIPFEAAHHPTGTWEALETVFLICAVAPTTSHCVTSSTALM